MLFTIPWFCLMLGCGVTHSTHSAQCDEWISRNPSLANETSAWQIVPESEVRKILLQRDDAVSRLREMPYFVITPQEAIKYGIDVRPENARRSLCVIRAVSSAGRVERVVVRGSKDGTTVWVSYELLTHQDVAFTCAPAVVILDKVPKDVFVTASVAE